MVRAIPLPLTMAMNSPRSWPTTNFYICSKDIVYLSDK